jgi:hypothetical protein
VHILPQEAQGNFVLEEVFITGAITDLGGGSIMGMKYGADEEGKLVDCMDGW